METKEQIITLLTSTKREGIESLIQMLENTGFFTAPASTKFHGCYAGGLADHSLGVYTLLAEYAGKINLSDIHAAGQQALPISPDNIIIAALLHDVCKIGAYIPNGDGYKWNRSQPKGHAKLSIERIEKFIKLTDLEKLMITYHMGVYGLNEFYKEDDYQTGEFPLRGDDTKSKEERYGKSLANTWYHNPIVKLMYFCDEIATFQEKSSEVSAAL